MKTGIHGPRSRTTGSESPLRQKQHTEFYPPLGHAFSLSSVPFIYLPIWLFLDTSRYLQIRMSVHNSWSKTSLVLSQDPLGQRTAPPSIASHTPETHESFFPCPSPPSHLASNLVILSMKVLLPGLLVSTPPWHPRIPSYHHLSRGQGP